jgi:hypothetical protein
LKVTRPPKYLATSVNMFIRSALLSLSALAAAKEMPKDEFRAAELYDSGIRHANNMAIKHEHWAIQEAAGAYRSEQYREVKDKVECINGTAITSTDTFKCSNLDLLHFLSHAELGSTRGVGSSSWGMCAPIVLWNFSG